MKLADRIGDLIREVESRRYPEDPNAYNRICESILKLKQEATAIYELTEAVKKLDNVCYMMHCYLPKPGYYDAYRSRTNSDNEYNYKNLSREKKRLITTLQNLKASIEKVSG